MTKQHGNRRADKKLKRGSRTGANATRRKTTKQRPMGTPDESTRLWLGERDNSVAEDSAYYASGAATGGGVDTPTAVEKSAEATIRKRKPIDQESSAYTGGGADNGTDL